MKRRTIQVGSFGVNCSIISEGSRAWIVDPGAEADQIMRAIDEDGLTPEAILLTHAHFDHIGGVPELRKRIPSIPVYLGSDDIPVINHPFNQYPPDYPPVQFDGVMPAQECVSCLPCAVEVIPTPGHTPGGVSYFFRDFDGKGNDVLFSGDTLFAGSFGRTDLPGGDPMALIRSLRLLAALPKNCKVVPGHGCETFIGEERILRQVS